MASRDVEEALTGLFTGLGGEFQKRNESQRELNRQIQFEKAKRGLSFQSTPVESADIEAKKAQARKDLADALATEKGSQIDELLFGGGLNRIATQGQEETPSPISITGGTRKVGGTTLTFETPKKGEMEATQASQKESAVRLGKIKEGLPILRSVEAQISQLPGGPGVSGRAFGIGQNIANIVGQQNPKVASYDAFLVGISPQLVRSLGDVGNIAVQERKAAIKLLPKGSDNLGTRAQKLRNFYSFIIERISQNEKIPEADVARRLNLTWIPSKRSVTSPVIESIERGEDIDFSTVDKPSLSEKENEIVKRLLGQ